MEQASRIIAGWTGASEVISHERIAVGAWKRAVGKKIAIHTRAVKLVRDTLVVEVEDDLWKSNLWSLRYQILRNLEKALGPDVVHHLELRVVPMRREPQRALTLADDADAIEDPSLRRIYKAARRRESA